MKCSNFASFLTGFEHIIFSFCLSEQNEVHNIKLWSTEKNKMIEGKEMFLGFQKTTETCRYFFSSMRYFNYSKDVF